LARRSFLKSNLHVKVHCHVTNKSSAVAEMGDRLATIDMGRKVGAAGFTDVSRTSYTKEFSCT